MSVRILLAEDQKSLSKGISYNLEKRGYEVVIAERGDTAFEFAHSQIFDLILLDVMMPGKDGFQVCAELRAKKILTPILMLTARHEVENRVKGLELGADDYLGKPFVLEELLARVQGLLRRKSWDRNRSDLGLRFEFGGLDFDSNLMSLSGPKAQVEMTAMEVKLLRLLIEERGNTIARAQILKSVWGLHEETQTRSLDNFVMRLRQHIEEAGGSAQWIQSVRGIGYRLKKFEQATATPDPRA
jgi:two-component system alkaline phosphatase synthesis response regulator PhoP